MKQRELRWAKEQSVVLAKEIKLKASVRVYTYMVGLHPHRLLATAQKSMNFKEDVSSFNDSLFV